MPRTGKHPLKVTGMQDDFQPAPVTIATITHIPMLEGYWAHSLDVLKLFFSSLFETTAPPFDLMVFDNNSCTEVQDYLLGLRRDNLIKYLILSQHNLKKLGALNFLLSTAPGEYVSFADSDVFFLPGWLDASLSILDAFPEAGKVTALPIVGKDTTLISASAYQQAHFDPTIQVECGILVPDQYVRAHQLSLGQTEEQYLARLTGRKDTLLTRDGVQALLSTADFQFTLTRSALQAALPLRVEDPAEYYDPIYSPVLEKRLDANGIWQLSTPTYLVHHMGNQIPDFSSELSWLSQDALRASLPSVGFSQKRQYQLTKSRPVRRLLRSIHTLTYKLLYEE